MDTATIALIIQALVRYGPAVAKAVKDLFTKANPTDSDWTNLWTLVDKSYDDYVKPKTIP